MKEGKKKKKIARIPHPNYREDCHVRPRETVFVVVVWTGKGDPFVELIHFQAELWQQVLPNLVICFKTHQGLRKA